MVDDAVGNVRASTCTARASACDEAAAAALERAEKSRRGGRGPGGRHRVGGVAGRMREVGAAGKCRTCTQQRTWRRKRRPARARADGWSAWLGGVLLVAGAVQDASAQTTVPFENGTFLAIDEACTPTTHYGLLPSGSAIDPPGLAAVLVLLIVFVLYALSYVVERVMLPAIHVGIAQRVKLPESVSGASLLALGGCTVPLVAINLLSLTQEPSSPTGVAAVLGSAAFNLLFVLPVCFFMSDWKVTPLYWWPLVRDLSTYMIGLGLVLAFFSLQAGDWEASAEVRAAECWPGQEALCCYQAPDPPESAERTSLAPSQRGVLVWWEGVVILVLYALYLLMLLVHHKLKWAADSFVHWLVRNFWCTSFEQDKARNRRSKLRQEQESHREKDRHRTAELDTKVSSKLERKARQATSSSNAAGQTGAIPPGAAAADNADGGKAHVLQLVASVAANQPAAVHRVSTIIVLRFQGGPQAAFAALGPEGGGDIPEAQLINFIERNKADVLGKTFLANNDLRATTERLEATARTLFLTMRAAGANMGGKAGGRAAVGSGTGPVTYPAFEAWYLFEEARLVRERNAAFDLLDETHSGEASVAKLGAMLEFLGCCPSRAVVRKTREKLEINQHGSIGRSEFDEWFRAAMAWEKSGPPPAGSLGANKAAQDAMVNAADGYETDATQATKVPTLWGNDDDGLPGLDLWDPPENSTLGCLLHALGTPVRFCVIITTQAWSGPVEELSFPSAMLWLAIALVWIWFLAWTLLWATESVGHTVGIPCAVLGSTVLAIGLNAPHFLSSMQRAITIDEASMRSYNIVRSLEHAIKGNVFDLLFGLPFAWIVANLVKHRPIHLGASNLVPSMGMLLLLVFLSLVLWVSARWELNHIVCATMLVLYVLFVLQDLLLADWAKPVPSLVLCAACRPELVCASA